MRINEAGGKKWSSVAIATDDTKAGHISKMNRKFLPH